jgi:hypothetical protein
MKVKVGYAQSFDDMTTKKYRILEDLGDKYRVAPFQISTSVFGKPYIAYTYTQIVSKDRLWNVHEEEIIED